MEFKRDPFAIHGNNRMAGYAPQEQLEVFLQRRTRQPRQAVGCRNGFSEIVNRVTGCHPRLYGIKEQVFPKNLSFLLRSMEFPHAPMVLKSNVATKEISIFQESQKLLCSRKEGGGGGGGENSLAARTSLRSSCRKSWKRCAEVSCHDVIAGKPLFTRDTGHVITVPMNEAPGKKSGCLGMLLAMLGIGQRKGPGGSGLSTSPPPLPPSLPFRLRDDFLSAAEISFYHVLLKIVDDRHTVCPKVNLNDIFYVERPHENQSARNQIDRKHVDFLICERGSMRPLVGVELDDGSHARTDRKERDAFVDRVYEKAGLPLLHFPVGFAYNLKEVADRLLPCLATGELSPPPPSPLESVNAPTCPACLIPLVVRRGQSGLFYGCSNYPKCRQTAVIPEILEQR